ncbi:MAG: PAS domain-containing protein [Betaproteobacteria bacterium]|nr:PAS domain-containing protein [Betaproteobacteria bacterium]
MANALSGLEYLATAVVVLDEELAVRYVNPAAESLLESSAKGYIGLPFLELFSGDRDLEGTLARATEAHWDYSAQNVAYSRPNRDPLQLSCVVTRIDQPGFRLLAELRPAGEEIRHLREELLIEEQLANRDLLRNLAHEVKNPLGGLRGSAQLLERELERPELREYTQVIIKEADRLQALVDRLLTPQRAPMVTLLNFHEVLERVRSLILAEFPANVEIRCDYDPSVPDIAGDKELLIQAVLNVVRNAAQALTMKNGGPGGTITLRTRIARQVTLMRQLWRLALELQVIDDGPGVPAEIRDRIFSPLVSGRPGGSGLGLSLAQTYVTWHKGMVECESKPGRTVFRITLPLS